MKEKMQLSRSQKCFIEAILKLMQLKPYAEITVTEISEYAQYDRRTFYRYFKCKDDILYLYYATLLNEMATSMNQKGNLTPQSGFSSYFEFWFEHKEFLILLEKHNLMNQFGNKQEYLLYQYVGKKQLIIYLKIYLTLQNFRSFHSFLLSVDYGILYVFGFVME